MAPFRRTFILQLLEVFFTLIGCFLNQEKGIVLSQQRIIKRLQNYCVLLNATIGYDGLNWWVQWTQPLHHVNSREFQSGWGSRDSFLQSLLLWNFDAASNQKKHVWCSLPLSSLKFSIRASWVVADINRDDKREITR